MIWIVELGVVYLLLWAFWGRKIPMNTWIYVGPCVVGLCWAGLFCFIQSGT